ncbi:Gfo/Idh/MocA family oxidoreductase [Sphingobium sp.]|uniref:Gfo/Idh/MocA family protein n=1 Tax=Sphingobium sp. TaxID=1912891 RepID=UPI002C1B885E|nr:Gfo/Idh/MocA family oxidoreductase [Sphingobium sp.]HUD93004.1 Gfo/Idh/MocA family oxidoreductase [Sphingobium sp.]
MTMRVGIVGCGDIAGHYLRTMANPTDVRAVACAARSVASARRFAAAHGIEPLDVDGLLARDDIDIVLNLAHPDAHGPIGIAALEAGKHVFQEKPIATCMEDARRLMWTAARMDRRVGVAPDTLLGPPFRIAQRLVAEGVLGELVMGMAHAISIGPESRHPAPAFLYRAGAGPVLDMAPYALSILVALAGPVERVAALGRIGRSDRRAKASGAPLSVEVPTSVQALLRFAGGFQATLTMSWDGTGPEGPPIALHGTRASLFLPDPNWFGGAVSIVPHGEAAETIDTSPLPLGAPLRRLGSGAMVADYRGAGLADMARSIAANRPHQCSGENGLHLLEVTEAILASAAGQGDWIGIDSPVLAIPILSEAEALALAGGARPG